MAVLWTIVFRVGPWLQSHTPVAELHAFVEAHGIDATALYYSDSDEFGDVPLTMQNSLRR